MRGRCRTLTLSSLGGQPVGDLAGPVGRVVVDDQDPRRRRAASSAPPRRRARCSRPRCRSAGPARRAVGGRDAIGGDAVAVSCSMTNAEIAAALDELGVLYELDGAVKYRVLAYGTAAKAIRESPVSVAELAARGPGDRDPRRRQDAGGKDRRPARDRRDPRRGEAEGEVPADPDRGDAGPRARARKPRGGSSTSSASPRSRTSRRRPRASGSASVKGLGPKVEENVLAALERLGEPGEGAGPAAALQGRARSPRSWRRRCASTRPPTGSRSPARCGAGPRPARTST